MRGRKGAAREGKGEEREGKKVTLKSNTGNLLSSEETAAHSAQSSDAAGNRTGKEVTETDGGSGAPSRHGHLTRLTADFTEHGVQFL